jgi:hypothetical protein
LKLYHYIVNEKFVKTVLELKHPQLKKKMRAAGKMKTN